MVRDQLNVVHDKCIDVSIFVSYNIRVIYFEDNSVAPLRLRYLNYNSLIKQSYSGLLENREENMKSK